MRKKELINQSAVASLMSELFKILGVDKAIAAEVVNDPIVKKEIKNLQKSMSIIKDAGERFKRIRSHNNVF